MYSTCWLLWHVQGKLVKFWIWLAISGLVLTSSVGTLVPKPPGANTSFHHNPLRVTVRSITGLWDVVLIGSLSVTFTLGFWWSQVVDCQIQIWSIAYYPEWSSVWSYQPTWSKYFKYTTISCLDILLAMLIPTICYTHSLRCLCGIQ